MVGSRRARLAVAAAMAAALAQCPQAWGASASVGSEELALGGPPVIFTAGAGEANRLTVSSIIGDPNAVVFRDAGATIAAGEGCAAQADGSVTCRVDEIAGARVQLEDGDDQLDASGLRDQNPPPTAPGTSFFAVEVEAGDGDDVLVGADASFSCLRGGAGDDRITAAVSAAAPRRALCGLSGGEGDDRLIGSETADVLSGGPGEDSISAGRGDDQANGGAGIDGIRLGVGRDAGGGGGGDDELVGGAGNDSLADSDGADVLDGQGGHDRFRLDFRRAEGVDQLLGGSGLDTAEFSCPSCRVTLNARADDGERGTGSESKDDVRNIEHLITTSYRYGVVAEALVRFGPGNDILVGNASANLLEGTAGPDLIVGAGGSDRLRGGPGPDRLNAADGDPDRVSCGGGVDRAQVDRSDRLRDCERVRGA